MKISQFARSTLLYTVYWLTSIPFGILYILTIWSKKLCWPIFRTHLKITLWLFEVTCGIKYEISGKDHIPDEPCIFASIHESTWENMFFQYLLDNPAIIIKKEILSYPFAGQLAWMNEHISTPRNGDVAEFQRTLELAKKQFDAGRNILIFPSGTRKPEHRQRIQNGVYAMYRVFDCPCVPIVHNSGDCWGYGTWLKRPGTIRIKILPPIKSGLSKTEFRQALKKALATDPTN